MTPAAIEQLVKEFSAQGIHRTGWPADELASGWICDWLKRHNINASIHPFPFGKLQSSNAYVQINGLRIDGTPLYDGGITQASGITGPLSGITGPLSGITGPVSDITGAPSTSIRLLEPTSLIDPVELMTRTGEPLPAAAIVISADPQGEILLRNAEHMKTPRAIPILQVAGRDAEPLRQAAATSAEVKLVIDYDIVEATASNVIADISVPGSNGLMVLMTPKSGWFSCAAERGGGIVIALAMAAAARELGSARKNLRVLFTSGHELGHAGLLSYLEQQPHLRHQAELWIHLGASIGARFPLAGSPGIFSREQVWRDWFIPVLARHGAGPVQLAESERRPGGESREVFDRPFVSMAGGHRYFHSPQDTPDLAVDAASIARYCSAYLELLKKAMA